MKIWQELKLANSPLIVLANSGVTIHPMALPIQGCKKKIGGNKSDGYFANKISHQFFPTVSALAIQVVLGIIWKPQSCTAIEIFIIKATFYDNVACSF